MSILGAHGINYKKSDATQRHGLGDRAATKKGKFEYVKASAAIAQYSWVIIAADATAQELTSTLAGGKPANLGVAQVAIASGEYGWVFIGYGGGSGFGIKARLAASCAAGARLTTMGTAGVADDAVTGTNAAPWRILNCSAVTTVGGVEAATEIYAIGDLIADCTVPVAL